MSKTKVIVSLSGGMDSATLLAYLIDGGYNVKAVSFLYGSKHNKYELKAAKELVYYYGISNYTIFDLQKIFVNFRSNLMLNDDAIPEGHYNDSSMSKTVVPGRNHIFASILAGMAESFSYEYIALAVHQGDHHIYPDCRPNFINVLRKSVELQSEGKVSVLTPFIYFDKEKMLKIGLGLNQPVPYQLTRTCYKDQELSCGKCGSCVERLEAWEKIGKKDPVKYE